MKKTLVLLLAPYHLLAMVALAALAITLAATDAVFVMPTLNSYKAFSGYLLLPVFLLYFLKNRETEYFVSSRHDLLHKTCVLAATFIGVVVHFFLKMLALVWRPEKYDAVYAQADAHMEPVMRLFKWLANIPPFNNGGHDYQFMYLALFWIAPIVTYLLSYRVFVLCMTMILFNLLLGSLAYLIAPAYGPFVLEAPYTDIFRTVLAQMKEFSTAIEVSGGKDINPDFYWGALAAMPSLHVSQATCILWAMLRMPPSLTKIIFVIFSVWSLVYITVWAPLTGYHYLVDVIAGFAIAGLCIVFSEISCKFYLRRLAQTIRGE